MSSIFFVYYAQGHRGGTGTGGAQGQVRVPKTIRCSIYQDINLFLCLLMSLCHIYP